MYVQKIDIQYLEKVLDQKDAKPFCVQKKAPDGTSHLSGCHGGGGRRSGWNRGGDCGGYDGYGGDRRGAMKKRKNQSQGTRCPGALGVLRASPASHILCLDQFMPNSNLNPKIVDLSAIEEEGTILKWWSSRTADSQLIFVDVFFYFFFTFFYFWQLCLWLSLLL